MAKTPARRSPPRRKPVGLALAGGGPFGAIYEIGALMALQESLEGIDFHDLDVYVGVSAGSFLTAALANGIPVSEIHALFIGDERADRLPPGVFMRPALREYLQRALSIPPLLASGAWAYARRPFSSSLLESLAALGRAVPTGLFESEAIHDYLAGVFSQPGNTNDFRSLRRSDGTARKLYLVATDLDTGESVSFGRPGRDHVPISRAVQASAALPGLFPPVAIDGRFFVDGALRKTLHASEALDDGARLVICVNPLVPYDARLAEEKGEGHDHLVEGGLPRVLSQTFRAILHSRMTVGLKQYRARYRGADVLLFEPGREDREAFFTNIFSYATRRKVCEHAYRRTRRDLLKRRYELEPVLARHGIRLRLDVLQDGQRRLASSRRAAYSLWPAGARLPGAASELRDTLVDLKRWLGTVPAP
jgi:NTE family protein